MAKRKVSKLDRALKNLFVIFSVIILTFCLSLIDHHPSDTTLHLYSQDLGGGINEHEVDMFIDYDFVVYQVFTEELAAKLKDKQYAIAFHHFSDSRKDFSINGDKVMGAASTYKLFTAFSMFMSNEAPACLKDMIVYSDNDCPENWGRWSLVARNANSIGATSTNIATMPTETTANDLALFLTKLYEGSLLPENETKELLAYMKIQVYREGIPTGIPDAEVADKVGFLDGVLNDAGIVYSEKGDFVLVILTDGYSWQSIAETASSIYAIL